MKKRPPEIRILSEDVANRIAAGEVIERPAAVAKELLENAVDAGATRVDIEFKHGGKSFIKVLDNGCGMTREQALMSLEPHATSKIREPEDLFKIMSYGFRGEALPSIASVSKFRMRTRPEGRQMGTEIDVYAGQVKSVRDCGMAEGTEIIVENLFCSVPVRRKFLKTDNVEASHITKLCRLYALALPNLAITLIENSRVVFRSEQDLGVMERIGRVFGGEISSKLVELKECRLNDMKVCGAILAPGESFATNRNVCSFINGRPVDSRAVYSAIKEAYAQFLPKGRHAAAFLFMEMDPASVDVNVHPAKREVRLKNEFLVRDFLLEAMAQKLRACTLSIGGFAKDERAESPSENAAVPKPAFSPNFPRQTAVPKSGFAGPKLSSGGLVKFEKLQPVAEHFEAENFTNQPIKNDAGFDGRSNVSESVSTLADDVGRESLDGPQRVSNWRYIGAFRKKFAVFETPKSMVLMSVSAAIKRVQYERIMRSISGKSAQSQGLLIPITLKFERSDDECFRANRKTFDACGFSIEDFGKNIYRIMSAPSWLAFGDAENFLRDFVELARDENRAVKRALGDEVFARLAVRRMGAAGFVISETSAHNLLSDLLKCPSHMSSPDGKPTLKEISDAEIMRMFAI